MPLSPYYTKEETEAQEKVICLQLLSYPDTELGLEAWSMTSEMLGTLSSVTLNSYFMSLGYFFLHFFQASFCFFLRECLM